MYAIVMLLSYRCHAAVILLSTQHTSNLCVRVPRNASSAGLLPADEALAGWLRKQLGPERLARLLLVVNKCERRGRAQTAGVADVLAEAAGLGLGEPVALSAQTGEGLTELYAVLQPRVDALTAVEDEEAEEEVEQEAGKEAGNGGDMRTARRAHDELSLEDQVARIIGGCGDVIPESTAAALARLETAAADAAGRHDRVKMVIMGLPNAVRSTHSEVACRRILCTQGKSTLTNLLLQEERVMVGPEPGLTRDPIQASFDHNGTVFDLVDTPGWMKRTTFTSYDESQGRAEAVWRVDTPEHTSITTIHYNTIPTGAVAGASQVKGVQQLNRGQVVVVMVDSERLFHEHKVSFCFFCIFTRTHTCLPQSWIARMLRRQELVLAQTVTQEGRAIVVALNKMDTVPQEAWQPLLERVRTSLERQLPQASRSVCIGSDTQYRRCGSLRALGCRRQRGGACRGS